MKYGFTFLIVLISTQLYSKPLWKKNSAVRPHTLSFDHLLYQKSKELPELRNPESAYSKAVPYEQLNFFAVTRWSEEDLRYVFSRTRDERFIKDGDNKNFPRRSSWLYPNDGCWARAALSAKRSGEWGYKRPNKAFVFGDLEVKTPNSKEGKVSWWYHVVPIVILKDGKDTPVVLDPAIEPKNYLTLQEWLLKMGDPSKMNIAICNTYTYGPMDTCETSNSKNESEAMNDQLHYLPTEWKNLENLNRNPSKELGDSPPWITE